MRIGARISTVAVASSLVALAVYGVWALSLRRDQLWRELVFEQQSLATVLRSALETALEHRNVAEARDVVEQLSAAERVYGIGVHAASGNAVAMSKTLEPLSTGPSRAAVDEALADGRERQFKLEALGRRFLVHVLPLKRGDEVVGVAEVWRDLSYIDEYLRGTASRLVVLALGLGLLLSAGIVLLTRRAVTQPAAALIRAMDEVAGGNLSIRVGEGSRPPRGELGDIARSFDQLARGLEQARAELEKGAADREALASQLRQSERLATLGQIVAEVAHELGTPLNVISGRAEDTLQAAEALRPDEDPRPALETALANARDTHEQARRIAGIIRRLLNLARERMPELGDVAVLDVARRTAGFLASDFARARVELELAGDAQARARADENMLQQVLINLLNNALQASPAGGRVNVTVTARAGHVLLDVRDQGCGVRRELLPRLFEPFATTKPAGQGTGLGLAISRSILRQLGGSLRFVEHPGAPGAHFQAALPAADAAAPALPAGVGT